MINSLLATRDMRIILFFPLLILVITSCSYFFQNDFISTKYIGQIKKEKFIYSAFQTGLDNYRIEFKCINNNDTLNIFDFYINDAIYSKEGSFQFEIKDDTLKITSFYQAKSKYYSSKNGNIILIKADSFQN